MRTKKRRAEDRPGPSTGGNLARHVSSFTPANKRRDLHEGPKIKAKGGPTLGPGEVQRTVSYLKHAHAVSAAYARLRNLRTTLYAGQDRQSLLRKGQKDHVSHTLPCSI
jgi:hypothetical protein